MAVSDETRRSLDRDADGFCRAFATPVPTLSKTSEAPVVAVHDDGTLDVGYGGAVLTVRMTTACAGVAVGDTVLLTAYGQMLYATGILARDNGHYVKVLKSGIAAYMHGGQTEVLPEPISKQPHGIVLHWSGFSENGFVDYARNHYQFIPKTHVDNETYAGKTVQEVMGHGPTLCYKTLYVYDDRLVGIDENTGTRSGSGVTYDNSAFVLREIISV